MRLLIALFAAAALTLAGCGTPTATSSAGSELIGTGKVANLDFTGTTLNGAAFDGTSLEGKAAVLWFWSPWCPTCRAQSATVSQLAEKYDGRVTIIGVGGLDDEQAIRDLAGRIPHVTHLVDHEGQVWKHFGVTAQSTYEVIAADREILVEGYLDNDELVALVDQLAK